MVHEGNSAGDIPLPARGSMMGRTSQPLAVPLLDAVDADSSFSPPETEVQGGRAEFNTRALGEKTISFFGSVVLTINNVSGPGMLALPLVMVQAGWFPMILGIFYICMVSSLSAIYLCDAIARIPGNDMFRRRVEFSTAFKHYYGQPGYLAAQLGVTLCLMSQALAGIIATAQVMDQFLVFLFNKTFALQFTDGFGFIYWSPDLCTAEEITKGICTPFAETNGTEYGLVLTLGYFVTLAIIMPMGAMNLEDNIWVQYISFFMLVVLLGEFLVFFGTKGLDVTDIPAVGTNFSQVLGTIIFNFAFVVTIPSWVNEKKESVSVTRPLWFSTIVSSIGYVLTGLLGAWAFPHVPHNFLKTLASRSVNVPTRICAYLFSVGIIGLGVPVFLIMMRYNLIVGRVCRPSLATFWGVIFPWMCAWLFYQGNGFLTVINWTSLIVNGFVNFICPLLMSIKALGVDLWRVENGRLLILADRPDVEIFRTCVKPMPKFMTHHRQKWFLFLLVATITPMILISIGISIQQAV